jgi:putative transport protein
VRRAAAIVATCGLVVAYVISKAFDYDAGTAAGLVAGALTESAAIGTAMDTISRLDSPEVTRTAMANNIPVAFAVTYLAATGAAWCLQLAPKLMRVNLADECRSSSNACSVARRARSRRAGIRAASLRRRRRIEMGRPHGG